MARASIYARVSTDEQAAKFGLTSQVTELLALAKAKGLAVDKTNIFSDDGYSGASLDRPALDRLRDHIRQRSIDLVLVHDPDRLSRRLAHQLLLLDEFERRGVRVEFQTTPREDTPEGRLFMNMKGAISEYEREKIRERTSRGRRQKARDGKVPTGCYAFGYAPDPGQPGGLGIVEDEAKIVRLIFGWFTSGDSIRAIKRRL